MRPLQMKLKLVLIGLELVKCIRVNVKLHVIVFDKGFNCHRTSD